MNGTVISLNDDTGLEDIWDHEDDGMALDMVTDMDGEGDEELKFAPSTPPNFSPTSASSNVHTQVAQLRFITFKLNSQNCVLRLRHNAKHSSLKEQHSSHQERIHSANQDRDVLLEERASLQSQVNFNQSAVKQLQQKLGEVASELSSSDRAPQNAHSDLRAANRRAEEAERTQRDLRAEGTRLMQSLGEMRPKFVELTSTKMDLMERIDKLEHEKNSRDTFISKLENALSEAMEREAEAAQVHKQADSSQEKDKVSLQQSIIELQQGYAELQAELESSQAAAVLNLEGDRTQLRQIEARQLGIIDRLSMESDQHSQSIFEPSSDEAAPRSPDDEMISALKVQHALDLSNANSQIRALETTVFEAQAKSHSLQTQISILEDQLAQQRSTSRATSRPFSPGVPGRPSSRALNPTDLRRATVFHSQIKQSCLAFPADCL
ncbi:hypothetical protein P692DRAFT_20956694 [Suillus brevipes Sb2]|nr:hypothetical protein P692DRAFT_20956694 [Suillus brevipes Sb2]